ncbi:MAG: hypothetical protein R3220_03595 [Balneolaceae bacterium]|nr:hypothetical protein [Balneolaceae bacterium]
MNGRLHYKKIWKAVKGTDLYSSGKFKVTKSEVQHLLKNDVVSGDQDIVKFENNQLINTELETDNRVVVNFFPLKNSSLFVMEVTVTKEVLPGIEKILPETISKILRRRDRLMFSV